MLDSTTLNETFELIDDVKLFCRKVLHLRLTVYKKGENIQLKNGK